MKNLKIKYSTEGSIWKSALLTLPMMLIIFIFITGGKPQFAESSYLISFLITFLFLTFLFFAILFTGKTDKYRAVGFILMALFFAFTFIVNLIKIRGSMTFNNQTVLSCEVPFCHIVTTMIIIPAVIKQSIIFPGSILKGFASISSMLIIVIGSCIALGRGFCSWGCFYGGWDDGASRIMRKSFIKKVNPVFRWFSFAMLVIVALTSAMYLFPSYCDWLCPFKMVTEYEKVTSIETLIKTIIFIALFLVLVIALPLLTKKRIQCATFCPMGALLSLTNKINIFTVKIDKEKCNKCCLCVKNCPILALSKDDVNKGKASITCSKCGKCIDVCPQNAIQLHIKGTKISTNITFKRYLFLLTAYTLLVVLGGGFMLNGIVLIIKLLTTGSLL